MPLPTTRCTCRIFVLLSLLAVASCGSKPTGPLVQANSPALSCPASITVESVTGAALPVTFTVPTAVGGEAPVSAVTCTAQPGATFPLGSTIVTCTATDGFQRQGVCSFTVTVATRPSILKTKFLAFGDSLTFGRCNIAPAECPPYTVRLRELLEARYASQTFTITNVGIPGEIAADDIAIPLGRLAGQDRLPSELARYSPEVLLLMEGANDLFFGALTPTLTFQHALGALDRMATAAQAQGVIVFLATIPPQRSPAPAGTPNRDVVAGLIPSFNDGIRAIAASRGATLVDVYAAMVTDIPSLIGADNLHPTEEGLRRMGEIFYAAIRNALDNTPTGEALGRD